MLFYKILYVCASQDFSMRFDFKFKKSCGAVQEYCSATFFKFKIEDCEKDGSLIDRLMMR
jgi:hypothetical protein